MVILSLVDFEGDHSLFVNIAIYDQSTRVNLTESVLRTGVPPTNPLFFLWAASPNALLLFLERTVRCRRTNEQPSRPCSIHFQLRVGGIHVAALMGLYLKHFLGAGIRVRRQLAISILLLAVTGLDICVISGWYFSVIIPRF